MKHILALAILAISLNTSTGCTSMSDVGGNMARTMRMFRPRPFDDSEDPQYTESAEDPWSKMMGDARPRDREASETDSLWRKYAMSPQSRSIERSLGVGP
ncbi:MAG: hypothetical protein MK110_04410 [Fuerstiella sp.]|nr:hypothetical protein [Fuerstiella sp.]